MRRRSGGLAEVVPSMLAISHLEVSTSIRMTLTARTIREEARVGDEEGDHRVDLVGDQVGMDQGVMAGMEVQEDSDLCTIS